MEPQVVQSTVVLLLIACMVASFTHRFKQPYTIALVLVGLVVAVTRLTPSMHISHDVTFMLILPPLLFQGAMRMDLALLKENWKIVLLLAIPGVICSTFLIGAVIHQIWGIGFLTALLFGALITPTDPVSVLAILKRVGAPKKLLTILEGESLFNDGTGVVVFSVILGLGMGQSDFQLGATIGKFFLVTGGATVIGILTGLIAYKAIDKMDDHLHEIAVTVVLVFGTPLLAEALHCSGIIAIVVAGMIMGNHGKHCTMAPQAREALKTFWDVIEFLMNSLIFLIIGIELQEVSVTVLIAYGPIILLSILVVLIARLIVVYPMVAVNNTINQDHVPMNWSHILFWGGLKGSIPIALVVGLPAEFAYRSLFLTAAFCIVLFSLIIQGLSMRSLVRKCGLSSDGIKDTVSRA